MSFRPVIQQQQKQPVLCVKRSQTFINLISHLLKDRTAWTRFVTVALCQTANGLVLEIRLVSADDCRHSWPTTIEHDGEDNQNGDEADGHNGDHHRSDWIEPSAMPADTVCKWHWDIVHCYSLSLSRNRLSMGLCATVLTVSLFQKTAREGN